MHRKLNVVIAGNIGCGKTTITEALMQSGGDFLLIPEPVQKWRDTGFLELFYQNEKKYAFSFQQYAYITRLAEYCHAVRCADEKKYQFVLFDSHFMLDSSVFMRALLLDGKINQQEFQLYKEHAKTCHEIVPTADADYFIYLLASPELCQDRIKERNRSEESTIPIDYLKRLKQNYDDAYSSLPSNIKKIKIDADLSLESKVACILNFLKGIHYF